MDELSKSITLSVDLVIIAIILVLSITVFTSSMVISRLSVGYIEDIKASVMDNYLSDIDGYNKGIPTASIYVLLEKNRDYIKTISGNPYGIQISNNVENLKILFGKKLRIVYTKIDDRYDILLMEE